MAKAKTLVNTATIQWIHSMTKYHEVKVTTTKNKRYMYISFQKYPNWENRANVRPVRPATWKKPTLSSTLCTITKLIHVLILLLSEIPQPGKQDKHSPHLPATQETPEFTFSSTWLDNNEIIDVSIYFQAHPTQALQLATTYQCCIQAQSWPNISNKCLWYRIDHITVQKKHHHFLSAPVPHQHKFC